MFIQNFKFDRSFGRLRKGAAAVEAAFCIPILIILMFGTLETCSGIFLTESLKIVAYEGARVGVRRGANIEQVRDRCADILSARKVNGGTVTITPEDFNTLDALEPITVTVTAPYQGNSSFVFRFFKDLSSNASVSMMREFDSDEVDDELDD